MAKKFLPTIKRLQRAINGKYDKKILVNQTQFYSPSTKKPVQVIVIKQAQLVEETGRYKNVELFRSPSDIQAVLFLRDIWYQLEGIPIPQDNPEWLKARKKYEKENGYLL